MVFWWTGRGYLGLLTLIGVFGLFGAGLTVAFGEQIFEHAPWLWGIGAAIAATVNWIVGSRVNRRPIKVPAPRLWKSRLTYRPPNRLMSLPLEVWSAPMMVLAIFLVVRGLLP
ncbi:hypothetical protein [uncultured Caulobacter sp.]|uniref:hypothetical protein n=1 Tax=uncultured Caulobacter sp. TaxID=158749 RepID=UPI0026329649|nr:hypothetical protein [uncultured Caulobacter sp.]